MIYLTLLLLVIALLFSYRKLSHQSARFMYGIIFAWGLSFTSFILYLSKFNYYQNMLSSFFSFSPNTWNYLVLTNFDPNLLVRFLNGGVLMFNYSLLGFAVSFTRTSNRLRNGRIYSLIAAISLLQLIYFDPTVQIWLQMNIGEWSSGTSAMMKSTTAFLNGLFNYINFAYLIVAFVLMLNYYFNYPKIKFIKNYALYHMLILAPVAVIHCLIFSWAPTNLVIATVLPGYYNYVQPNVSSYSYVFFIFPYLVILALTFMIFILYRFSAIEAYNKNLDIQINKSIDTASLGVKAFTHSLKNHLLAIQFEADYLKETHTDKESTYSLDLILASCSKGMESITFASAKLQAIKLNLQPHSLDAPVNEAISRLSFDSARVELTTHYENDMPFCYLDPYYMTEAITNLLENALESLRKQPTGHIHITLSQKNNWAILVIHDNGPGITEENIKKIFSPFFTTKVSVDNWGIGLSYCHKIIRGHDGKIVADSTKEQGTSFKIFLPII